MDHASGLIQVYDKISLGVLDTFKIKDAFEPEGGELNLTVYHYHGDNAV